MTLLDAHSRYELWPHRRSKAIHRLDAWAGMGAPATPVPLALKYAKVVLAVLPSTALIACKRALRQVPEDERANLEWTSELAQALG